MILLRALAPFSAVYVVSNIVRVVNAVLAPDMRSELGLDASDLGLIAGVFFLAFGICQIPVGALLDRFGPRVTVAPMMAMAAVGCGLFAVSSGIEDLVIGRALIGAGVSGCLMGAYKAHVIWLPRERLAFAAGLHLAAGGLGAVLATAPSQMLLELVDWREIVWGLAGLITLGAASIWMFAPKGAGGEDGGSERRSAGAAGYRAVLGSRIFWQVVPICLANQAAFMAVHTLWLGPWYIDVAGASKQATGIWLFSVSAAMLIGFLITGHAVEMFRRRGIAPENVAFLGALSFTVSLVLVPLLAPGVAAFAWLAIGFLSTTAYIPYTVLSLHFPAALLGRATTTLNVFVFVGAFIVQWLMGAIVDVWPQQESGGFSQKGFEVALWFLVGLNAIAGAAFIALRPRNV